MNKKHIPVIVLTLVLAAVVASPVFATTYSIENADGTATYTTKDNPAFNDAGLKGKCVINFKKGDFMLFGADTVHSWKNGPKETQVLF